MKAPMICAALLALALALPTDARMRAPGVARDSHGRIERSAQARRDFKRANPCPATGRSSGKCPGFVIDHVIPLKRGGPDNPSNMQWQTIPEARAKDRIE